MAYDNQEIELKLSLTAKEFQTISEKLAKIAKFAKSSHHIDDYFNTKKSSFLKPKYPFEWLTVRVRDGKTILNYKHWYPENTKYTTHCDEFETEVVSRDQIEKILFALKFEKFITVEKKRKTFIYDNALEIAMDEVVGLGYFIEVETIKAFKTVVEARKSIVKFTKMLGLKRTKTVPGGYAAELMRRKKVL